MRDEDRKSKLTPAQRARPVMGVRLSRSTARRLRALAKRVDKTVGEFVEELVGKVARRDDEHGADGHACSPQCRRMYRAASPLAPSGTARRVAIM